MNASELNSVLVCGEDSRHQFKQNVTNVDSLAADMVAFSNGDGGKIYVGVNDDGTIKGFTGADIRRLSQLVSNAASNNVTPAINPVTQNVMTDNGLVMVVSVAAGINKPYQDKNGVFWVKSGSDKRKATSREEIQRLFQRSGLLHGDEIPVQRTTVDDLDEEYFKDFFRTRYGRPIEEEILPLSGILENMGLLVDGELTVSSTLLFGKSPQYKLPTFVVKAGTFDATDLSTSNYSDSRDIYGKLADVYRQTVYFIVSNIRHIQGDRGFNSVGIPEIPHESIEELVANALIHRDYFVSAPIKAFVFRDRVEIISPGHLPNNLTVEKIKLGNSVVRNPSLASFAYHLLPYRGYGSGIIKALEKFPHIEFEDDRDGNLFRVTLKRGMYD